MKNIFPHLFWGAIIFGLGWVTGYTVKEHEPIPLDQRQRMAIELMANHTWHHTLCTMAMDGRVK